MRIPRSVILVLGAVLAGETTVHGAAETARAPKPAVLFLSLPMQMHYGGAYLRRNMVRLDKLGYRVAYYHFKDPALCRDGAGLVQSFDVVVLLDQPGVDWQGDGRLGTDAQALFEQIRALLRAGGGLLVFNTPSPPYTKSLDMLAGPYGCHAMTGCFVDEDPVLTTFGALWCAYTTEIAHHPLADGVAGFWYPIGAKTGGKTHFDTLRNANSTPFDVDASWTVLAGVRNTTSFKPFAADEGADDPWLQQSHRLAMETAPAPLVAVRDGAEGKGRVGFCAVNMALSDFVAGNEVYNGICTGKGVEGRRSDLDRLLMNVVDWLGATSVAAGRETIAASQAATFTLPKFKFPDPHPPERPRQLLPNPDQLDGLVGARTTLSGGRSTVAEYAAAGKELGLDFIAFLEDFSQLDREQWPAYRDECAKHSDDKLLLIPGIRVQDRLGIHFFGFKLGLELPLPSQLVPGERVLSTYPDLPGQYRWVVANGGRSGMACGNFRLEEKTPNGVPPSDYNVQNPFVALYTYRGGELVDTLLETYLKCAARTEWVSPMAVHLVDSADELRREWASDHFKTVYLRDKGTGLAGFSDKIGDRFAFMPVSYVTNGPRIAAWHSTGHDCGGGWWDWTRLRRLVRLVVTSDAGLREVRIVDGERPFRRFLPAGATRFEHTLVLTYHDMTDLIVIATDVNGRQAVSDEEWGKNQLLQLTWCADRNNMLSYAGLPAPKSASGSTAGNYPTPWNLEKGGFRENLVPAVNQDRSRLPHFDGQPMWVARVSPAPQVFDGERWEGGQRIARDFGRDLCSPDTAIQTASCRLVYEDHVEKPHPWTRGPLRPMRLFNADLRYTTFSHAGHLPAPVILEGKIRFLRDLTPGDKMYLGVRVLTMTAWNEWGGYDTFAVQYAETGNMVSRISYVGEATGAADGLFTPGAYVYFYPSVFGSVGIMSLCEGLSFQARNRFCTIGVDTRGKAYRAGDEFAYRLLVFVSGFDEPACTRLPEALRRQLGMDGTGAVSYTVKPEHGTVADTEYVLAIDGKGVGFAGEILLPRYFPVSLPIIVENLNDRWTSVLYDRARKRLRPLGMTGNAAYCHRAPAERRGRIFIGHPFTLDDKRLWLSVVQTHDRELTLQIHNPTDQAASVRVTRSPFFDFVTCEDIEVQIPAGRSAEYVLSAENVRRAF